MLYILEAYTKKVEILSLLISTTILGLYSVEKM